MEGIRTASGEGKVTCAAWIRRPENAHLVVLGKLKHGDQSSSLQIFSFDRQIPSLSSSPLATHVFEERSDPVNIAVHPSGDDIVCSTTSGDCKWFELNGQQLLPKELLPLQGVGPQKCLAFSTDGSRFATGGVDGHLRIFEWPSMQIIIDEPRAHKSFNDMDFSLDSEFLASTSTDGSARIWNTIDGVPLASLTRNSDEKIELCRFSKDGTKPFLFCTVQKGNKVVTAVWDISTWNRIGHKRLLRKPASVMSISLDGKYIALFRWPAILAARRPLCWNIEINVLIDQIGYMIVKRSGSTLSIHGPLDYQITSDPYKFEWPWITFDPGRTSQLQDFVMYNRKDLILQIEKDDNSDFFGIMQLSVSRLRAS